MIISLTKKLSLRNVFPMSKGHSENCKNFGNLKTFKIVVKNSSKNTFIGAQMEISLECSKHFLACTEAVNSHKRLLEYSSHLPT